MNLDDIDQHAYATLVTSVHKRMHEEQTLRRAAEVTAEGLRRDLAEAQRKLRETTGGPRYFSHADIMAAADRAGLSRPARCRLWIALTESAKVGAP